MCCTVLCLTRFLTLSMLSMCYVSVWWLVVQQPQRATEHRCAAVARLAVPGLHQLQKPRAHERTRTRTRTGARTHPQTAGRTHCGRSEPPTHHHHLCWLLHRRLRRRYSCSRCCHYSRCWGKRCASGTARHECRLCPFTAGPGLTSTHAITHTCNHSRFSTSKHCCTCILWCTNDFYVLLQQAPPALAITDTCQKRVADPAALQRSMLRAASPRPRNSKDTRV
jgi:hypothetical protein